MGKWWRRPFTSATVTHHFNNSDFFKKWEFGVVWRFGKGTGGQINLRVWQICSQAGTCRKNVFVFRTLCSEKHSTTVVAYEGGRALHTVCGIRDSTTHPSQFIFLQDEKSANILWFEFSRASLPRTNLRWRFQSICPSLSYSRHLLIIFRERSRK